ncbi:hypothetical protein M408DRAFT_330992 [Serendipita vermifera MAFF 305830]|uniref:Uncharacterized protein n=1 Tax=Serendipita vermifera MAFF 305830 TaxID=933852 RepID=A0A0C2WHD2_SERVB|nr:hypothetical protein M408DRAFT_330992 [Serendipita vermifera MAFF 305830]
MTEVNSAPDQRYFGSSEALVFSIDCGTTQSACAFAHLFPGSTPQVRVVTKWPGQEEAAGDSKIPTLVAYKRGKPIGYGADAIEQEAAQDGELAKWFKLHLHPDSMKVVDEPPEYGSDVPPTFEVPSLPTGVTLKKVYKHFLKYLWDHAQSFFINNTVDGERIWNRLGDKAHIVLATPNGWDTTQQGFLRQAMIDAGIITKEDEERLSFVTEGEASVHYALHYSQSRSWMNEGSMFAVTDAGGSTVDSTLYRCKALVPKLVLEEVCASECVQAGGVFVDRGGQRMLNEKLSGSKFADAAYMNDIMEEFERKTKRKFDGTQTSIIRFGKDWDNDRPHGIVKGRLTLTKEDVTTAFNAVTPRIVSSVSNLLDGRKVEHLLLVGGLGESPYLRKALKDTFGSKGVNVVTVDESTKKAAAEGAALWYIRQLVVARAVRSTFGIILWRPYDPASFHRERRHRAKMDHDGSMKMVDLWETWLKKDHVVGEETSLSFNYFSIYKKLPSDLGTFSQDVFAYDGEEDLVWGRDDKGSLAPGVRTVCTLRADLTGLRPSLRSQRGPKGEEFYRVDFVISVMLGGTSLKARLNWNEGDERREGPVTVIPNSIL